MLCVLIAVLLVGSFFAPDVEARGRISGYVERGGVKVVTPGATNSKAQGSYPGATVTGYLAGTSTLATIYSDSTGTAKANGFTAGTDGSYSFYVDVCVDVRFSGTSGGVALVPWTEGDM